jgi:two-component system chemotaxis response regulator CheB
MTVVGTASSAAEARQLMRELNPDVVTLDVEMPNMNGLDFLEKIMKLRPTPVIIVSSSTQKGAETTARALALGAVDCYAKAEGTGGLPTNDDGRLAGLIREAAQVRYRPATPGTRSSPNRSHLGRASLIAIGSSTGGVEALQTLLRDFPEDCPPTLIVQHLNPKFSQAVTERLDAGCRAKVMLAESDMPLRRGTVYFAPGGDRHLLIYGEGNLFTKLRGEGLISGHCPSVDALFLSVARSAAKGAVGILLTGMGSDGAQGLLAMAQAGAMTIAQDEATCTVFGMPRSAIALGAAQIVAPIHKIADYALEKAA